MKSITIYAGEGQAYTFRELYNDVAVKRLPLYADSLLMFPLCEHDKQIYVSRNEIDTILTAAE